MADIFQPSVRKREIASRSPISSRDLNAFHDEIVADFSRIARSLNDLSGRYSLKVLELEGENSKLRALAEARRTEDKLDAYRRAVLGEPISYFQSFRNIDGLLYTGVATARHLRVEPTYGEVTLPQNRSLSRFYSKNPDTDELFRAETLKIAATAVDEAAGDVKPGTPELALDGFSAEPWIRRVIFPLEDDQSSVVMDVDIDVPSLFAADANVLTIVPSPAGEVDIVDIRYSTTSATPSLVLPGFSAQYSVSAFRIHFAPLGITKLRIRLAQKHFVQEEGEKVFLYGLKEVGLYLVEFDKTAAQGTIHENNIAIFKVPAPSGYKFNQLKSFVSDPNFATGVSDNKIYFRIYGDEALTQLRWNSFTDPTPTAGSPLSLSSFNLTSLYVVVYLEFQTANKITPVVKSFFFDYTTSVI